MLHNILFVHRVGTFLWISETSVFVFLFLFSEIRQKFLNGTDKEICHLQPVAYNNYIKSVVTGYPQLFSMNLT